MLITPGSAFRTSVLNGSTLNVVFGVRLVATGAAGFDFSGSAAAETSGAIGAAPVALVSSLTYTTNWL